MDDQRFDALARAWATRRGMLKGGIAALAAAAGLGRMTGGEASGAPAGALCNRNSQCVAGICGPRDRSGRRRCACTTDDHCPGSECQTAVCNSNGTCGLSAMADGQECDGGTCCGGICRDTTSDIDNCDRCGIVCSGDAPACCASVCVDLAGDVANCGGCDHVCPDAENATAVCTGGVCGMTCDADYIPTGDGCCFAPQGADQFHSRNCGDGCCLDTACDSAGSCCFEEQVCGTGNLCCPGNQYCLNGACRDANVPCDTNTPCLTGETCINGACCPDFNACAAVGVCCAFSFECAPSFGCVDAKPAGGMRRY